MDSSCRCEDTTLTLLGLAIIALAAQHPPGAAKFLLLHSVNPDTSDARFVEESRAWSSNKTVILRNEESPTISPQ